MIPLHKEMLEMGYLETYMAEADAKRAKEINEIVKRSDIGKIQKIKLICANMHTRNSLELTAEYEAIVNGILTLIDFEDQYETDYGLEYIVERENCKATLLVSDNYINVMVWKNGDLIIDKYVSKNYSSPNHGKYSWINTERELLYGNKINFGIMKNTQIAGDIFEAHVGDMEYKSSISIDKLKEGIREELRSVGLLYGISGIGFTIGHNYKGVTMRYGTGYEQLIDIQEAFDIVNKHLKKYMTVVDK
jgi:hypothetical protein